MFQNYNIFSKYIKKIKYFLTKHHVFLTKTIGL